MPTPSFAAALAPLGQALKRLATIQPQEAKVSVGLDIGSAAVKVVALGPRGRTGERPVLHQNVVVMTSQQLEDPSEVLKAAVGGVFPPTRAVNLAVNGQWVIMRIIETPPMKPGELKQALPYEAQRYLPFNLEDVILDGAVLGPADAHKVWVLIIACKKDLIERRLDWLKRAGLEPALIDVDAVALANAFLASGNGRKAGGARVLVNIGAQLTNLVIFKGEIPYLIRDIPWGGEKLARHTAEHLGVEVEVAGKELALEAPRPEVLDAMKLAAESLVTELQLSFDYFENRFGQPPDELLASGGVAQAAGFLEALKSHLTQPVSGWSPAAGLSGQFAVAYGLALRSH